jgi:hypothetical protein
MINNKNALPAKHSASLRRNQNPDEVLPDILEVARLRPAKIPASLKPALLIPIIALAVFAVSCKVGPNYVTPKASVAGQWMENSTITNRPFSAAEDYWWRNFDDPVLNQLVEMAYRNNPSLQAAGVSILGARAQLNKSIGNLCRQLVPPATGNFRPGKLFLAEFAKPGRRRGFDFRPDLVCGHVGN